MIATVHVSVSIYAVEGGMGLATVVTYA
jgi:hypothetical protein